jgi:hypothetical protein
MHYPLSQGKEVKKMPEIGKSKNPIINAMLAPKAEYVRVADWQGKSLTFILADEVLIKQKPGLLDRRKNKNEKSGG